VDAGLDGATRRIPAPIDHALTEEVRQAAAGAFRAVGAEGVARVDCFVDESSGDVLLGEINTVPGSFSWYLWQESGLNFADLMDRLLMMGLQRHALKMELELTPVREPVARL
jgi:D-alanine-D-alanine ligase